MEKILKEKYKEVQVPEYMFDLNRVFNRVEEEKNDIKYSKDIRKYSNERTNN